MNMSVKEIDLGIQSTAGTMSKKALKEYNERKRTQKTPERDMPKRCPFMHRACSDKCVFYDGDDCGMVTGEMHAGVCPYAGTSYLDECNEKCKLYDNGRCALMKGVEVCE